MDSEDVIEREFKARELDWLSAIEWLQGLGYQPEVAEDKVSTWNAQVLDRGRR